MVAKLMLSKTTKSPLHFIFQSALDFMKDCSHAYQGFPDQLSTLELKNAELQKQLDDLHSELNQTKILPNIKSRFIATTTICMPKSCMTRVNLFANASATLVSRPQPNLLRLFPPYVLFSAIKTFATMSCKRPSRNLRIILSRRLKTFSLTTSAYSSDIKIFIGATAPRSRIPSTTSAAWSPSATTLSSRASNCLHDASTSCLCRAISSPPVTKATA
jgi:hypothetical protein